MKHRLRRVAEVLRRELGSVIVREIRFESPLVTISGVDITPDLKSAHVFVSAIGNDAQRTEAIEMLEKNRAMLQAEISKRVILKHTPHLHFKLDESIERGARIIDLMDQLGLGEAPEAGSEETKQ